MGVLKDLFAARQERVMERRVLWFADRTVGKLERDGQYEEAGTLRQRLRTPDGRDEVVAMMVGGFQKDHANQAIGDGEILSMFLTWLTEGGGFEMIMQIIQIFISMGAVAESSDGPMAASESIGHSMTFDLGGKTFRITAV